MPTNSDEQRKLSLEERIVITSLTSVENLRIHNVESVKKTTDIISYYVEQIKEPFEEFIKQINEIHTSFMWELDRLDHDTLREHFNEGVTIDALKEHVQSVGQYLECTSKILYKFGKLNDEEKQQGSDLVAEKLKIIEEISNPKSNPNACRTCCALSGGAIIGAAIAYLAGAATLAPAIVAVAVFIAATVVGALVGYGIGKSCEKVSEERQKDRHMSIGTVIKNVLTPECLKSQSQVHP
ncbi:MULTISPECIES: hypothetical protein [unclassified Wolbachia]|uniref:hypothetical protein n=2 Tax=Wolbachia TaxID=953 RepID=UPI0021F8974B|nr:MULTISPECIES: hypothetical protein [unclassified Wolbachia]